MRLKGRTNMVQPENSPEQQLFRVDLQVLDIGPKENRLAVAGFLALAGCSYSALQASIEDIQRFGKGFGVDPTDPAHKVYPLCEDDAERVNSFVQFWPNRQQTVSFISLSYD
jgi:hypothetical protein